MKQLNQMTTKSPPVGAGRVIPVTETQSMVWCPHCWTQQRAERQVCYQCGAQMVHLPTAGDTDKVVNR